MNRRDFMAVTSIAGAGATVSPIWADVARHGALGDGAADDAPAIQAALDEVGRHGGGVVTLPPPAVHYRVVTGLRLPSNVVLEGPAPVRYPFNAGNRGACAIVADFDDTRQWVIEAATRSGGRRYDFDDLVGSDLPDGVIYNCGVRNLLITSKNKVPFGGIRMHGAPGSLVEGVSIDRVGCGLLVNCSFGGRYQVHAHTLYYGVAAWDDANANSFEVYCSHSVPWPKLVPPPYRLPFLAQMEGHFADTLKLSDERHADRPYGVVCGSLKSASISNVFDAVVERFPGGVFMFNAYATDFRRCYLEADADVMACGIAATRSRFGIDALHAYLSGTGMVFDLGIEVLSRIFASGILHAKSFGKPPVDDGSSLLLLEGAVSDIADAPEQPGIRYVRRDAPWTSLSLQSGWRAADGYAAPAARPDHWSHHIELRGAMLAGRRGTCFILPASCRPRSRRRIAVVGATLDVSADGTAIIEPSSDMVSLDGAMFTRW